jgi:hypothetical protein
MQINGMSLKKLAKKIECDDRIVGFGEILLLVRITSYIFRGIGYTIKIEPTANFFLRGCLISFLAAVSTKKYFLSPPQAIEEEVFLQNLNS